MIITIIVAVFLAIALVATVIGGPPERIVGVLFLAWYPINKIEIALFGTPKFDHVDPSRATIDTLVLVLFVWLALRANRVWPIVCAGAQCVAVGGHLAAFLLGVIQIPYFAMTQISSYVEIVALAVGTWAHWRRKRRIGPYRSWRTA